MLRLRQIAIGRAGIKQVTKRSYASGLFDTSKGFQNRHIGPQPSEEAALLKAVGHTDIKDFVKATIPSTILTERTLDIPYGPISEVSLLARLREIANKNKVVKSYIGQGYYNTHTPKVVLRNVLENPVWYTSYTPYQPEISQGRLQSLFNFQTMVADLTKLPMTNASLLDEGTAAAEAMVMTFAAARQKKHSFFVDSLCHPQTIACIQSRATGFGINVIVGEATQAKIEEHKDDVFGVLVQYPATDGSITDYSQFTQYLHSFNAQIVVATDLLALTLLKPPGEWNADIVVGNSQRFGVPLGFGGPHAAFFACADEHKRRMPGRIVGLSVDRNGDRAYRLALQTREQHIRREKATSNICTAQALLANMAAMYGCFHGPDGLKRIAERVLSMTAILARGIEEADCSIKNKNFFDTLSVSVKDADEVLQLALSKGINLRKVDSSTIALSLDETVEESDLDTLLKIFDSKSTAAAIAKQVGISVSEPHKVDSSMIRTSKFMQRAAFLDHRSETEMLRYIHELQNRDLSLTHSMIALGSCTMKLNATTQMIPISWPEFNSIHPFAPYDQATGYHQMLNELEEDLAQITGFDNVSLQPNSGAQGEYTGLRVIKAYLSSTGQDNRNICLIPVSAHGTNPASATMAGLKVVSVKCDAKGNLDMSDLQAKCEKYKDTLAAFMVTYPSTFGVFEPEVKKAIELIHVFGGQVYMDGANLNAQIGLCSPGDIGADVCHLNLHKTFCIPHGGGGPGMGPIGVKKHLSPFLPGHPMYKVGGEQGISPVSAAPYGSASILPISWAYIKLLGGQGLTHATRIALLNANYMAQKLAPHYKLLYTNDNGKCAHEFILDTKELKTSAGIEVIDIAKRLQDYGFHAPTMSWPVQTGLMIEPTESESVAEMDRFCDAMISIRNEIKEIEAGKLPRDNNMLKNAPHPMKDLLKEGKWDRPYTPERAAFPLPYLWKNKFWPSVGRLDDQFGDLNLCTCDRSELDEPDAMQQRPEAGP